MNRVNYNPQAVAMVQKQFVKTGQIFFYREYHQASPPNISFATCSKGLMRNSLADIFISDGRVMGCHHLIKQMDARGGVKQNGYRFNQHMERVE
jgi:hypothetical protein